VSKIKIGVIIVAILGIPLTFANCPDPSTLVINNDEVTGFDNNNTKWITLPKPEAVFFNGEDIYKDGYIDLKKEGTKIKFIGATISRAKKDLSSTIFKQDGSKKAHMDYNIDCAYLAYLPSRLPIIIDIVSLYPTTHTGKINTANSVEIPYQTNKKLAGHWKKNDRPISDSDKEKGYSYTGYVCPPRNLPDVIDKIQKETWSLAPLDCPFSLNK
jgi:hypothetical protein